MNLKLCIASFWMPDFLFFSEINRVALVTTRCLDRLLEKYAPEELRSLEKENYVLKGNLEERRGIMAEAHNIRVKALIDALGCDDAVKIGRAA